MNMSKLNLTILFCSCFSFKVSRKVKLSELSWLCASFFSVFNAQKHQLQFLYPVSMAKFITVQIFFFFWGILTRAHSKLCKHQNKTPYSLEKRHYKQKRPFWSYNTLRLHKLSPTETYFQYYHVQISTCICNTTMLFAFFFKNIKTTVSLAYASSH